MNYLQDEEARSRRIDSDLISCAEYNDLGQYLVDVAYILAAVFGANEDSEWFWLAAMKSGTYAVFSGGCDYTGWDCQSWGGSEEFITLKEAIDSLPEENYGRNIKNIIKGQLVGTIPYGAES